ncbi:amidohydrolase [Leucobacter denitrificans]|uniref:amidohydrolase n=1 Tax=Leucobacter denitrificans TaxID=683042 RepID=UPI0031B58E65
MTTTIYRADTVFTGRAGNPLAEAVAVRDGRVLAVGSADEVAAAAGAEASIVDLGNVFVAPGFVESHTHMLMLGQAVEKVQLRDCESVAEIQSRLRAARDANPEARQILGISWRFEALAGADPTAAMLDEAVVDVPVVLDANDLHSAWVNSAALDAIGITDETPDPIGGEIRRDAQGKATGFLLETAAMQHAWPYIEESATEADRDRYLQNAFRAYIETGVTTATEMALNEADLAAFERMLDRDGRLPFAMTAHVILQPSGAPGTDRAQVERAAEWRDRLAARCEGQDSAGTLRIAGVKFILDGVIDACTAAMRAPYANGSNAEPIWPREDAIAAAVAADSLGLQLAIHAIGDAASELALELVEACERENGPRADRRPRIEHLESVTSETIHNMARLGITASMQPVHCDPAIMDNWLAMLGDERAERGFPWHEFRNAGVHMALGTDAPTAPHEAPHNLFIAMTARSVLERDRRAYAPERVFTPADALEAMTYGGAWATRAEEEVGALVPGALANFVVLDANPLADAPEALLDTKVRLTVVEGRCVTRRGMGFRLSAPTGR